MQKSIEEREVFLYALNVAINNKVLSDKEMEYFQLTSEQWNDILNLAQYHNVFPLVFEKLSELEAFVHLPEYSKYTMQAMSMVAMRVRKTETFLCLYQSFRSVGVYPLVMKGLICRQLYGIYKDHRPSGDEDILVQKEDFEQVEKILIKEGFIPKVNKIYTEAELIELKELAYCNQTMGLSIEVHINPVGRNDSWRRKANEYFKDVFENAQEIEIDKVMIKTMSHTDNLLFLIIHTLNHFIIGGVGIRQVLDVLLYLRQYGDKCDWDYLIESLKELKADLFFSDLIQIGNQYLGFDLLSPTAPNCPEFLLSDFLESGTFGNSTEVQRNVTAWTSAALEKSQNGTTNKVKEFMYVLFPKKSWMLKGNPELAEKPWLLPISWVQRWIRILKRNSANGNNLISESKKLSQQRIELLKKYKIL